MHPQLRSARLYIAQQRSAAQCGAVPCPSFSGAVSCGAVRSFEHTVAVTINSSIRYDAGTRFMYEFCIFVFLLSSVDCPLSVPMLPPPRKYHTYCRSERLTSTSTQHSAVQLALHEHLLALLSIRYSHQIITGLFFLLHFFTYFS